MTGELEHKAGRFAQEAPTAFLRFIERDGKRILQQRWAITTYDNDARPTGQHGEWRDVPLRPEDDPRDSE